MRSSNGSLSELVVGLFGGQLGCGCLIVLLNLLLGGWSVDYLLQEFFNKNIHWFGDVLIGLFVGQFSIPVAIVVWLLHFFGAI